MEQNEGDWKETVREIFDFCLCFAPDKPSTRAILKAIMERHHDYFCGRKRGDGE